MSKVILLRGIYATERRLMPVAFDTTVLVEVVARKTPDWLTLPPTFLMASFSSFSSSDVRLQYSRTMGMYSPMEGPSFRGTEGLTIWRTYKSHRI